MNPLDVAQTYFDAWNRRDPAAIVATFVEGGTYSDPIAADLSGQALVANTSGLFAAFPDLSFEIVSTAQTGDHTIAAQWMMRGTNTGPFAGSPPTGSTVALPGADFITVDGDKIRAVQGYFDQKTFLEQLGLQVIVQPYSLGPISFGTATAMQVGKHTKPGAFSLTSIRIRPDEGQQLRELGTPILEELAQMPGFISITALSANNCGYTITAWEDAESASQMLRAGAHRQAMQVFFGSDFAEGGMTSVWIPHHINALWVRCTACGHMSDYDQDEGKCQCGESLPHLSYW
jgi:steroid delta-isomerase-like uncharacterized protein